MTLKIGVRAASSATADAPLLAILVGAGREMPAALREVDRAMGGMLSRTYARGDFRGGRDETLHVTGGTSGPARVLLVGMGTPKQPRLGLRRAATLAARQAHRFGTGTVSVWSAATAAADVEAIVVGLNHGCWEYSDLKSATPAEERRAPLSEATILTRDPRRAAPGVAKGTAIAEGYAVARRLAQMPGNVCTPDLLAATAAEIARRHKLKLTVLGRKEMEKEGMGSFLCVAAGTPQYPKLIALEYRNGRKGAPPLALVGKGLCFDTGGISIKPAERMEFMKFDMCGAAGVLGAMEAIARLKLRVNVVGLIGATTNMPSGTAIKPGDVVKASNGKSIEIINTDAEGRLVLADVLHYASRFSQRRSLMQPRSRVHASLRCSTRPAPSGTTSPDARSARRGGARQQPAAASPSGTITRSRSSRTSPTSRTPADVPRERSRPRCSCRSSRRIRTGAPRRRGRRPRVGRMLIPRGPTGVPVGTFVEFVRGRRCSFARLVAPGASRRPRPLGRGRFATCSGRRIRRALGATPRAPTRRAPARTR
ncbi:MAG: M17 family peptidase N-terminal domain-containing protein [Gemmatimonadaceae bacterium]